jgi:DNA-binding Lrp family transcriptional regulator
MHQDVGATVEPPVFDTLDLKLIEALQIDGRAAFGRIAQVLGVSDQTVARRYKRLYTAINLRVVGQPGLAVADRQTWLVRIRCTPDGAERLADALAKRPDTRSVALISGGTEVTCALRPRSERGDELLLDRIKRTPQVASVTAQSVLHCYYDDMFGWFHKNVVLDDRQRDALRRPAADQLEAPFTLDEADHELIGHLAGDGRATVTELHRVTGQPASAIERRLERMRSCGALYFTVDHDRWVLGQTAAAQLWLTVAPRHLAEVGQAVAAHPEVLFAAATTGKSNLTVSALFRDPGELYSYISERIGGLEGVQTVETAPVLRLVKQLTYQPRGSSPTVP